MSEAASRNRNNRAKGGAWETRIRNDFRDAGYDIERTRNTGKHDEGDEVIRLNGLYHVIEAKNVKRINLPDFIRQAEVERDHFAANRGLALDQVFGAAFIKTAGKASAFDGIVAMSGREYARLIKAAVS